MRTRVFLLLAVCLSILQGCKKQGSPTNSPPPDGTDFMWVTYTVSNSLLPNNQVNSIIIDNKDVKWIGTAGGLVRITGNDWTIFNTENSALPSSFIQALAVTGDGSVWVGTDKGLARFSSSQWSVYNTENSVLRDNAIMSLAHDTKNDIIWIGTAAGLVRANRNGDWKLFDEMEGDLILSMAVDKSGALWLGSFNHFSFRGRIKKLENENWVIYQLDQLGYASTFPYGITVDDKNRALAVLTGTSVKSVIRNNGNKWEEISGPAGATGLKTILTEGEKIWVGGNGLAEFGSNQSSHTLTPGTQSTILAMARDSKNKKWLGTIDAGVFVYYSTGK